MYCMRNPGKLPRTVCRHIKSSLKIDIKFYACPGIGQNPSNLPAFYKSLH